MPTKATKNKREMTAHLRRADVKNLFLRGERNQTRIAEQLREMGHPGVIDQSTVSKDLKILHEQMQEQIEEKLPLMRKQLHAKILTVQAEAWEAWEGSKQPTQSIKDKSPQWKKIGKDGFNADVEEALEDAGIEDGYILSNDIEVTMTSRDANASHLSTILNSIKQERELFNVDIRPAADEGTEREPLQLNFANLSDTEMKVLEVLVKAGDEVALARYLSENDPKAK